MRSETQKRIEQYKAMLPGMKERVIAVALLLAMSVSMMASASFAWLTISRAPEVSGMSTTIAGNGNLEIALANGIYGAATTAIEKNVRGRVYSAGDNYGGGAISSVKYTDAFAVTITYKKENGEEENQTYVAVEYVTDIKNKTLYNVGDAYDGGTIIKVDYIAYWVDITYVPGGTQLVEKTETVTEQPYKIGGIYSDGGNSGVISNLDYERLYCEKLTYTKNEQTIEAENYVGGKRYSTGDYYTDAADNAEYLIENVTYDEVYDVVITYAEVTKENDEEILGQTHTEALTDVIGRIYSEDGSYNGGKITDVTYMDKYRATLKYVPGGSTLKTAEESTEDEEQDYAVGGSYGGGIITSAEYNRVYEAEIKYIAGPGASEVGDSSAADKQTLTGANITWGNLINLSDSSYGLDRISLRPARLKIAQNLQQTPLGIAKYTSDGRLENTTSELCYYATWYGDDGVFKANDDNVKYGVRAITSATSSNISANTESAKLLTLAEIAYSEARSRYLDIIKGNTLVSSAGYEEVTGIQALSDVIELYVQITADTFITRLNNSGVGSGTTSGRANDFSGQVTYAYRLILQVQDVLDKEGEALLYLANCQAYLAGAPSNMTFTDVKSLLDQYTAWTANNRVDNDFKRYNIRLDSLATYYKDYNNIRTAANKLKGYAEKCNPETVAEADRPTVQWSQISGAINLLVNIDNTQIGQNESSTHYAIRELGTISSSDLGKMVGFLNIINSCQNTSSPADVILGGGVWENIENRLPADTTQMLKNSADAIQVDIQGSAKAVITVNLGKAPLNAKLRTTATAPFDSVSDFSYTGSRDNNALPTDLVAKDTYGLAIDLWVRTNAYGTVLNLAGDLKWSTEQVYGVDKNGKRVEIYTVQKESTADDKGYIEEAYQLDGKWYSASSHAELGNVDEMVSGYTINAKTQEVVTGYDGVNRVWEDYLNLIDSGLMNTDNTTMGAGSCYMFYADPAETENILNMLKSFRVAFVDAKGTAVAIAHLNTEHAYTFGGKTTVPLELLQGYTYTFDGKEYCGITALERNEATWLTAIVYLDGEDLTNEDVLAVGEIEGTLNIQFESSVDLNNMDDTDLRLDRLQISAKATAGSQTSEGSNQIIKFDYDGSAKSVKVELTVDGDNPSKISAFFVRAVGANGGTQGQSVDFTRNGNIWTATFDLTSPGTYSMRNLIVDGAYYALENDSGTDNFPTVVISGREVKSVYVTGLNEGVTMTAAGSYTAQVIATVADNDNSLQTVRAVFVNAAGGTVQSQLSYNATSGNWVGNVTFNSSGTYTLKYLYVNGLAEELPDTMQKSYILYLGLRAQVYLATNPKTGERPAYDQLDVRFDYTGTITEVNVAVRLFDDSGTEITGLDNLKLAYKKEGSMFDAFGLTANDMKWTADALVRNGVSTAAYIGKFQVKSGGTYLFDHLDVGDKGTVTIATIKPTITATIINPPTLERAWAEKSYQFAPDGDAYVYAKLRDGDTAKVWAEFIKDGDTTKKYYAYGTVADSNDGATFKFILPTENGTQDGQWTMQALYLQNCADANHDWKAITCGDSPETWTPVADECYVINVQDTVTTTVAQTVNITFDSNNTVLGKNENGIFRPFMQSISGDPLTVSITDYRGNVIAKEYITSASWKFTFDRSTTQTYGGYTTTNTGIGEITDPTATIADGSVTFTAPSFTEAGKYTGTISVTVGGKTFTAEKIFEVYSAAPTVKITGISPTGTFDVDKNGVGKNYHTSNGATASFTDTTANVYFKCVTNTYAGSTYHSFINDAGYYNPAVSITLSGIGNFTSATLKFSDETQIYRAVTYTKKGAYGEWETVDSGTSYSWTASNMTATRYIGYCWARKGRATDKISENGKKTPAGTITADKIVVTYNGVEYTFTIPTITINNPY